MFQCVSCQSDLASPFYCEKCDKLQISAKDINFFDLFELGLVTEVDHAALTKKYRSMSRSVHPDFNQNDLELAEELSTHLNLAHGTLCHQNSRLEYLLKIKGGASAVEDKRTDQSFLIDMMEFQERIEEEPNEEEGNKIKTELNSVLDGCLNKAQESLETDATEAARLALNEASYCRRLLLNMSEQK
jgi:Fe-S protein assembly co-chaperone HscB